MTGPEHYRLAERLLLVDAEEHAQRGDIEVETVTVAHAQVHATLALAAATALTPSVSPGDALAWLDAAGGEQP